MLHTDSALLRAEPAARSAGSFLVRCVLMNALSSADSDFAPGRKSLFLIWTDIFRRPSVARAGSCGALVARRPPHGAVVVRVRCRRQRIVRL